MKTNPIFYVLPTDTERMSAQAYLNVLESPEKIELAETKFVPPTIGESGFGHFLVKWHYPKYVNARG